MFKNKVAFLEGRLFSSQSELFEDFLNFSDWLDKNGLPKRPLIFWTCKQAIYLFTAAMLNVKQGSCKYQLFQFFGLTRRVIRTRSIDYKTDTL